jgi:hypothetical protein
MKFSWKTALAEDMAAQAIDQGEANLGQNVGAAALIRGELQMACLMHGENQRLQDS